MTTAASILLANLNSQNSSASINAPGSEVLFTVELSGEGSISADFNVTSGGSIVETITVSGTDTASGTVVGHDLADTVTIDITSITGSNVSAQVFGQNLETNRQLVKVGPNAEDHFPDIQEAIDSIDDSSATKPYVIQVAPGNYKTFALGAGNKNHITVKGSGRSTRVNVDNTDEITFQGYRNSIQDMEIIYTDVGQGSTIQHAVNMNGGYSELSVDRVYFDIILGIVGRTADVYALGNNTNRTGDGENTNTDRLVLRDVKVVSDGGGFNLGGQGANKLFNCDVVLTSRQGANAPNGLDHVAYRFTGNARGFLYGCHCTSGYEFPNVDDDGGNVYAVQLSGTNNSLRVNIHGMNGIIRNDSATAGNVSWIKVDPDVDANVECRIFDMRGQIEGPNATLKAIVSPYRHAFEDFTATAADPSVLTTTAHGLSDGDVIQLSNSGGALPAGLLTATDYYVVNSTANTFEIALSSGGSGVAATDTGTGTHTWTIQPRGAVLKYGAAMINGGPNIDNVFGGVVEMNEKWNNKVIPKKLVQCGGTWIADTSTAAFQVDLDKVDVMDKPLHAINGTITGGDNFTLGGGAGSPTYDVEGGSAGTATVVIGAGTTKVIHGKRDGNFFAEA